MTAVAESSSMAFLCGANSCRLVISDWQLVTGQLRADQYDIGFEAPRVGIIASKIRCIIYNDHSPEIMFGSY